MLIPDPSINTLPNCFYLNSKDKAAARKVIGEINDHIQAAVKAAINPALRRRPFEYVDPTVSGSPFEHHELCTSDNYFNAPRLAPHKEYSLHPNAPGQQAYWRLIENHLG